MDRCEWLGERTDPVPLILVSAARRRREGPVRRLIPQQVGVVAAGGITDDELMNIQENKEIVRSLIDRLFTDGDLSAVDSYLAEDFVMHDPPLGVPADREGMRTAGAIIRKAFPDWHSDLHMLVGEGDIVAERFTASGTHQGELMGVAPTGKTVSLKGINIFRVRDGRVVEWWSRLDELGLFRQLGLAQ
jgi:steroid delta-isomerase-like uncharacterized protein